MTCHRDRGAGSPIEREDAHALHEPPHPLAPDRDALAVEHGGELARPEEGVAQVQLVQPTHEGQLLFRDRHWPVVDTGARQPQ